LNREDISTPHPSPFPFFPSYTYTTIDTTLYYATGLSPSSSSEIYNADDDYVGNSIDNKWGLAISYSCNVKAPLACCKNVLVVATTG